MRLDGVDGAAMEDALRATDGRESKVGDHVAVTRERGGDDDSDGPDFLSPALLAYGKRGVADGETVVFSGDDASMLQALGEDGDPLGDRPAQGAAAECLGDVVSGETLRAHDGARARRGASGPRHPARRRAGRGPVHRR